MIRNIVRILGVGTLAVAFVFAACDQSGTAPPSAGSIAGEVTMEGRGLDGVTASLSNGTTATTAADGSFRFDGIEPGTYEVSISGYPPHAAFGATSMTVTLGTRGGPATVAFGATNSDRDALLALYDSTGGGGWTRSDNWDTSAPLGDWHGVTTDATGRVTELWLQGNNLRGTIPAAVGGLTQLVVLALFREAGLTGPIPPALGNLTELRLLALGGNAMTGAIPPELGNLTELIGLYLWGNSLTGGIPPELGNLSRLQALQLDGPVVSAAAHADGIPGSSRADAEQPMPGFAVPYRAQAREFRDRDPGSGDIAASRNNVGLTGPIPPGIWNLTDLTLLTLGRNRLTGGIPPEIGNLPNLEQFSVQDNQLTGAIPAALWTLTDLTVLAIAGNQLTGSVPREIGDLEDLEIFWAANNDLSGPIPPEIGSLDSLTHLGLHDNSLTGTVPASLGNLRALVQLALSRNDLQGAIPPELGNLGHLEELYLNQNRLDGGIPPELGALDSLTSLSLRENELNGPIPPEIGDLSKLVRLWVHSNPLSGPLPLTMTKLANLSVFNFSTTRLCVPDDQAFVSWLQSVGDVTGSGLDCGSISSDRDILEALYNATDGPNWTNRTGWTTDRPLGEWHGVTTDASERVIGLDLEDNNLSGPLPAELGQLDKLEELILEDAGISGAIPPELGKLGNLTVLSLGSNSLTGPIPRELGGLTSLKSLGIGGSPLTGSIPPELGNLGNLEALVLSGTDISDSIPSELGNLGNLTLLILAENNLSGAIPRELGNLAQLDALSLQDNDLSGPLPPELGNLANLEGLFLHDNPDLSGPLPATFTGLAQLTVLSAHNTRLCLPTDPAFQAWWNSGTVTEASIRPCIARFVLVSGAGQRGVAETRLAQPVVVQAVGANDRPAEGAPVTFVPGEEQGTVDPVEVTTDEYGLAQTAWTLGAAIGNQTLTATANGVSIQIAATAISVDQVALERLYEATDGPNWTTSTNWLTGAPLGDWHGVTADNGGRVSALNLPKNNLSGTIPAELGNLASLGTLALHENNLTGPIPPELGNLGAVAVLQLHQNSLTGPIPDSFLQLRGLVNFHADVHNCVPATDAFTAWLERIPDRGATLCTDADRAALEALYHATDGPNWTNSSNWTTGASLGDWHGVTVDNRGRVSALHLPRNDLSGTLPAELGRLASLGTLALHENRLTGPIPPELGNLAGLGDLNLWGNRLSGSIPPELANLASLWQLVLAGNELTGPIPPELGNLDAIVVLQLHQNNLIGPIPDSFLGLRRLVNFHADIHNCVPETDAFTAWLERIPDRGATLCTDADRMVLERLYWFTDGPNWTNSNNWTTGAQIGDWHGVITGASGRVVAISLGQNGLTGSIPPELGYLSDLEGLLLQGNNLDGPIPTELGNLAGLERLFLSQNNLTGPIPTELGSLDGLLQLALADNDLTGPVPPELGKIGDTLRWLLLNGNNLTGPIPESFLQLRRLLRFSADIDNCVPATDEFTAWLERISDGGATLCGADKTALIALYRATDGANWTNSTKWLTNAPLGEWYGVTTGASGRVERLRLLNNRLTGPIPPELGNLASLKSLGLRDGTLTGSIPPELGHLSHLQSLGLIHTSLEGPIPSELGNLDSLAVLALQGNRLSGGIPQQLGNLDNLRILQLYGNQLSGEIPQQLGDLDNLSVLALQGNRLSGEIPQQLGNLNDLRELSLDDNQLTGPIPLQLSDLRELRELSLSWNQLTGPIPLQLSDLRELRELSLSWNQLTGPIPQQLGNLANLEELSLGGNQLTGPIPQQLANLANLKDILLQDNQLTGSIPSQLGNLANMARLILHTNQLTGPIPQQLGDLAKLRVLQLEGNQLTGPIPVQLGSLANLEWLQLFGNQLTGPIPQQLGNLANLKSLLLSSNSLSGSVPPELGNLTNVVVLALTNNPSLVGPLPQTLTGLRRLEELTARGTGLCAPTDTAFQAWLDRLQNRWIASCVAAERPAAYLTQAVQSREFPVPLVAGERALLRVFPTARQANSEGIPLVRARFYLGGREAHVQDIAGKSDSIPTEVREGSLATSANTEIAGWVIQPGLEMVIEVDPDSRLDPGLGVATRIPETGRLAVEVKAMPRLDLTLVPFIWTQTPDSSIVDLVRAMAADPEHHDMLGDTRTLLPIGALAVTAHEPVLSSSNNSDALLEQTALIRVMEGGAGHYKGMMSGPVTGFAGVAHNPGRSSFSRPFPRILAHELGHNLSLSHAPCGDPLGPDPSYPFPDGSIGSWGYDFREGGRLVDPSTSELMSYCGPPWISDYHFTNALRHRLTDARTEAATSASRPTRSLVLWGGVRADTMPYLEPAFVVDAPVALPDSAGDYRVVGRGPGGGELFSLSFAMPETADGDGSSGFAFALPVRAEWEGSLAAITLSGPEGSSTLDGESDIPVAILRSPGTGQVRGILRDLPLTTQTAADAVGADAPGLEVLFSRGIPDAEAWRR